MLTQAYVGRSHDIHQSYSVTFTGTGYDMHLTACNIAENIVYNRVHMH